MMFPLYAMTSWIDLASQDYNIKASTMLAGGDTTDLYCVKELSNLQNWSKEAWSSR